MQPLGLAADPKAGLVHVLDRRTGTRSRTGCVMSISRLNGYAAGWE
jgi:hypothetical protein